MPSLRLRGLAAAERLAIEKLAHSHTAPARRVEHARIVWQAGRGLALPVIAAALHVYAEMVRRRIRRFNAGGQGAGGA